MNLTMNEIIEKDTQMTEVVDEQINKCRHENLITTFANKLMCTNTTCGRVFDEAGYLDPVNSKGTLKELLK